MVELRADARQHVKKELTLLCEAEETRLYNREQNENGGPEKVIARKWGTRPTCGGGGGGLSGLSDD